MGGEDDKIIRIPGETLSIKVSQEEEAYRKKYLPDAKKLTDEKLVCTVCSISLAQSIHKGKDVYVHRALQVLVCEACYNFYGDGCFSADEDGDDKYCRWCGQGGTLYLCSACNCAFCQKCTKQNLKASVLAELENDDWKCYICNPRPLFGCRTICWGAQQLNQIGKEKEQERLAKVKERLDKMEARKREQASERKSRKASSSEDEASTKKRKKNSDGDSSSPEVIPKRRKRESRVKSESRNLNGSIGRRRQDSSSDSELEDKKTSRHSRTSNTKEKDVQSSSEDESDSKSKKNKLKKKKKKKENSDDSSDSGKKKHKRRSVKKKDSSDDDDSSENEKLKKKKKLSIKKRDDSTDYSSNEKKKKKPKKKKNYTSSEESSGETKKKNKKNSKKKAASSSDKSSDEDEPSKSHKKTKNKPDKEEKVKKQETADSDNEQRKIKKVDSEEVNSNSAEDILVKKRIKLAILWLSTIVKDISELGTLISLRATKFSKKKINTENLKSYEDVLNCVSKIKQLISGVHSNYDHIEKTLESHLKPWKILTGLEDADNGKNVDGDNTMSIDGDVSKSDNTSAVQHGSNDTSQDINGTLEESKVESISEKNEETLNNWSDDSDDQNETRALISKANESLDKSQIEDQLSETGEKSNEDKSSEKTKIDKESIHAEESNLDEDVKESKEKSKTTKREPVKPDSEPKKTAKKNPSKDNKDAKVNSEKSSKSKKDAESNSENEERSPKKSSPLKSNSKGEKNGEESEAEGEEVSKGEIESEGDKENKPLQCELGATDHSQDSSDEDSLLESFASRLKDKWQSGNTAEDMNLKQSLEIDSSNQSDTVYAKSAKDKVLVLEKKNEGEKQTPKLILNKLKLEGNKEGNNTIKRKKDKAKNKHKTKQNYKTNCLSSSEEEEALERKEEKEEPVPKIVLKKLGESEKETKHETTNSSKIKIGKSTIKLNSQKKIEDKKKNEDKTEGLSSDNEEEDGKKAAEKIKVDKSKSKDKTIGDKSNCLSSSDEGDQKQNIKTKSNSSKTKDRMKTKEDQSKRSSEYNKKESDSGRSKRSINKKKTEEDELKVDSSEEDSKVNNKEKKSKNKDASGKKSKKDIKECDDEKDNKTKSHKNKLESKSSRKTKLKEDNSDEEESTRSKKLKLKKSTVSKENEKSDDSNTKSKNNKTNENNSVGLDSTDDEHIDTAVVENGAESDDEKSTGDNQEAAEEQEDVKNGLNHKDETDFNLELQASSTENTNNIEMVQVKEKKPGNEQKEENNEEKASDVKDKGFSNKEKTKFIGLDSSSEEEIKLVKKKKESPKKRPVRIKKQPRNVLVLSSDDEEVGELEEPTLIESSDEDIKEEKDEDFAVVVESSAESSGSDILPKNKRKNKGSSDSDASPSDVENNKKKKRRRIKCANSSDESGESGDENLDASQKNDGESPAKGGRKNIKKIKKKGDLEQTTIEAAEEERERRRRIEERQKLFNQVFEIKESVKLEKLVLDFDPETKKELISVDKDLVAKMKPHQAKGVKFMWDSCFESVKQIKKTKGSGCILAHCMGLGKTFQVISLIHTLLTHEDLTKVRTVMVVCPLSTVLNWVNEFGKWLEDIEGGEDIEVFHLTRYNKNPDRARELRRWHHNSGVLIMGYEMFRNLTNETTKKFKAKLKKDFLETLIDPGADLIVCDEGHMLKNEATALSKAMTRVRSLRRIVLTGTPMQNNLKEYHCMVQFVKPNLLGTSKEFLNRFVNPINNGQFVDSTDHDVKLMKRRAHVLHKMLEGLVQRFDYNVLTPFLPPKQEYVISVCLSELQEKLYSYYLENESQKAEGMKGGTRLFMDWQTLGRVWTHPRVLKLSTDKANWLKEKRAMEETDSEGSLKDFIDDDSDKSTTTEDSTDESSSDEGSKKKKKPVHKSRSTRSTRQTGNAALLESSDEEKGANEGEEVVEAVEDKGAWWSSFVEPQHFEDMRQSGKLVLLFAILKECELIEDKVLVFSQSLFSLDLIEYFLDKIDCATQDGRLDENLENHQGTWSKGLDYFRLDGSTSSENRNIWCKAFNREDNPRARLFLISTRAGGLGINLTAANRVIIFDASWNPSHDIQSIFRIYRFGQKKPCYVYRFVAYGTMEEKVYERQVAKQSISNRVVDEQQVHRHFSMNDLTELYTFTPASKLEERPTPALPRDPLMAEILSKVKAWIEKYHEHDSLLENVVEEELNEEERKAAWEDYENDKKRGFMPPAGPQGPAMNPNAAWNQQIEIMRQQLKLRYANKSDDEINSILVYQVSILMRQQQQQQMQMAAQMQAANNMGFRPQMYGNNMMPGFNQRPQMQTTAYLRNIAPKPSQQANYSPDQVYRMQQQANLARLQMQQLAQQQKTQTQTQTQTQPAKSLQSLLSAQLTGTNYPTANIGAALNARATAELQQMKQNGSDDLCRPLAYPAQPSATLDWIWESLLYTYLNTKIRGSLSPVSQLLNSLMRSPQDPVNLKIQSMMPNNTIVSMKDKDNTMLSHLATDIRVLSDRLIKEVP